MRVNVKCFGMNHRTAPLSVRERLCFTPEELRTWLPVLKQYYVEECALISTCNRTELYYVPGPDFDEFSLHQALLSFKGVTGQNAGGGFYALSSFQAVHHLLKLAAGVDSMVLGDVQVLNQVKASFTLAQGIGVLGPVLNRLYSVAMHAAKRARTETEITEGAVSAGSASAELVRKIFGDLSQKSALLVGAGETGVLTAKHLHGNSLGKLIIANRTRERAERLAAEMGAEAAGVESIQTILSEVDIVITSVAGESYVLDLPMLRQAMKQRGNRSLVVVDLGVPRNVVPEAAEMTNLFLHDIDGLQHIVNRNAERRRQEVPKVQAILLDEMIQIDHWFATREISPTIHDLQKWVEEIRQKEVERVQTRFSSEMNSELTKLTKRIVNKILHEPMSNLRSGDQGDLKKAASLLRVIFGLDSELARTSHQSSLKS